MDPGSRAYRNDEDGTLDPGSAAYREDGKRKMAITIA